MNAEFTKTPASKPAAERAGGGVKKALTTSLKAKKRSAGPVARI